jgi:hypothetical protein
VRPHVLRTQGDVPQAAIGIENRIIGCQKFEEIRFRFSKIGIEIFGRKTLKPARLSPYSRRYGVSFFLAARPQRARSHSPAQGPDNIISYTTYICCCLASFYDDVIRDVRVILHNIEVQLIKEHPLLYCGGSTPPLKTPSIPS